MPASEGDPPPAEGDDGHEPGGRANVAALIFIVVLFLGAYWVFDLIQQHRQIENCIDSGRRDCIDLTGQGSR